MSWFLYGDNLTKRSLRKGVWLRVRSLPPPLREEARKYLRKDEHIQWIIVQEIQPNGYVLLEFWAQSTNDMMKGIERHNVFHIRTVENTQWVCEGDLGRGYKESRPKISKKWKKRSDASEWV